MKRKVCTRKIDELGRIVLPQEVRCALNIGTKQNLDIYLDDDSVILQKNTEQPTCVICGDSDVDLLEIKHSTVCINCISEIKDY
ncbi:MAG: AbrB/MazE/SpoVT family DNA-binding domain-containing protein [Eubacteriales bacterium]|nr:AbrB/MazE/SpoVT family DNA-binding domain-containing protein [Eubacteriales bacterium]